MSSAKFYLTGENVLTIYLVSQRPKCRFLWFLWHLGCTRNGKIALIKIKIYSLASVTLNKWSKRAEILARQVKFGAGHFLTNKDLRFTAVNGPLCRIIDL